MSDTLSIGNKSIEVPLNPRDNPTSAQLKSEDVMEILTKAWKHYKTRMIDRNGRPLCERDGADIDGDGNTSERQTFSEGVSYVLLRAVWMNDEAAFYKTWTWTRKNLQRKNLKKIYFWNKKKWVKPPKKDHLFAWRYLPGLKGKKGGIIHYTYIPNDTWRGSFEAASDADLDIAASLIFAWKKWGKEEYLNEAKALLNDIWNGYVKKVSGKYYLFAGDQFVHMGELNPSYFRPAYFSKLFPAIDPSHPWQELAKTSYKVIFKSGDTTLHDERGASLAGKVNLPPNWVDITPTGRLTDSDVFKPQGGQLFGWDAFRTLFAVAQDMAWNGSPEARKYLSDKACSTRDAGPYCFLKKELNKGRILGGYNHDGTQATTSLSQANGLNQEQFAMYGVYLPYFYYAGDMEATQKVLDLLQRSYNPQGYWGNNPKDYYGQNWAWFGLALINLLPSAELAHLRPEGERAPKPIEPEPQETHLKLGKTGKGELVRVKAEENLKIDLLEKVLSELAYAPAKRVLNPNVYKYSAEEFKKLYPELARIKKLNEELYWYFRNFRSHWNNAILILSIYAQKIIESTEKDILESTKKSKDENLKIALDFAEKFGQRISVQEMADRATAKKRGPSDYSLALLDLTHAELYSQGKNQDESFYNEGIALAVSALHRFISVARKKRFPSKPDYFSIGKAILVLGDLYQQLGHLTINPEQKQKYLEQASYLYESIARLDPGDGIQQGVAGLKLELPEFDLKIEASPEEIHKALIFNQERGYINQADKDLAQTGIYYYLKGVALIKEVGLFAAWPKLKKPKEVLLQLLNIKKGLELIGPDIPEILERIKRGDAPIHTMNGYLLFKKKGELQRAAQEKDINIDEELNKYAQKLKEKSAFFLTQAKLVQGELLLALADKINYYAVDGAEWKELTLAAQEIKQEIKGEPYANLLSILPSTTTRQEKRELAGDLIGLASYEYYFRNKDDFFKDESGEVKYPYLFVWAKVKQLEIEVRSASYVKLVGETFIADASKLFKLSQETQDLLAELSTEKKRPEYIEIELDYLRMILHLAGKAQKNALGKYTFQKNKVRPEVILGTRDKPGLADSLLEKIKVLPPAQQVYFWTYTNMKKAGALIHAKKFKRALKALKAIERDIAPPLPPYIYYKVRRWEEILLKVPKNIQQRYNIQTLEELLVRNRSLAQKILNKNKNDLLKQDGVLDVANIILKENTGNESLLDVLIRRTRNIKIRGGRIINLEKARKTHEKLLHELAALDASSQLTADFQEELTWDLHALRAELYHFLAVAYSVSKKPEGIKGPLLYEYVQSAYKEEWHSNAPYDIHYRREFIRQEFSKKEMKEDISATRAEYK